MNEEPSRFINHFIKSQLNQIGIELQNKLQNRFRPNLITLLFYGSRIRGDFEPESDLDTLIVLDYLNEVEMERNISRICGELTRKFFIKVSPYTISKADFIFGCKNFFPFNLGVYLSYHTLIGTDFIEENHKYITEAIQSGKLQVYSRSGIFIQR